MTWSARTAGSPGETAIGAQAKQPGPGAGRPVSPKPAYRRALPFARPQTGRILIVNTNTHDQLRLEAMLLARGYSVVSASSFEEARNLLRSIPVALIVTSLHLSAFNGLHLAIRSRWSDPRRLVIVTDESYDPIANDEAESLGARYFAEPMENPEFLSCVEQALYRGRYTNLMA